jgi:hypothetical protein
MTLGEVLSLVGLVVTAGGFAVTISQLVKTANAAQATERAIVAANKRMLLNHVLVLVPQLKVVEGDLDAAIADEKPLDAIRALVAFSHSASQVAALLESDPESDHAVLVETLRTVADQSSQAKAALVSGSMKSMKVSLKVLAGDVSAISARCSGLTAYYQSKAA